MSTEYHPQTDSQTEVLNRCLEEYLRCFVANHLKGSSSIVEVDSLLTDRTTLLQTMRGNLQNAQQQMRDLANAHRQDISFQEVDWVFL